jgi:hypothetical protein
MNNVGGSRKNTTGQIRRIKLGKSVRKPEQQTTGRVHRRITKLGKSVRKLKHQATGRVHRKEKVPE